jgi:hypothetical protein
VRALLAPFEITPPVTPPTRSIRRSAAGRTRSASARQQVEVHGPLDRPPAGAPLRPRARSIRLSRERTMNAGFVRVFAEYAGDVREECDVVVVGSGRAAPSSRRSWRRRDAASCCWKRARLHARRTTRRRSRWRTMRGPARATRGHVIPTMQAIALGGGSP